MFRRLLGLALLVLCVAPSASAQFSRITSITGQQNTGTQAFFAASPFTIKAGAACTWSVAGTVYTFNCGGGAASSVPFSGITSSTNTTAAMLVGTGASLAPTGSGTITANRTSGITDKQILYNNADTIAGVIGLTNGLGTSCGGSGSACELLFTQGASDYSWVLAGGGAPASSYVAAYMFSDAGFYLDSYNGTSMAYGGLAVTPTGSYLTSATGTFGVTIDPADKRVAFNRYMITIPAAQTPAAGDVALSAGWGTTASVTAVAGSDNNPRFSITSGGVGQGANPTIAFTYHNGAFGATAQTWTGNCTVTAGTGAISPITYTATTTVLTLTYNATPVNTLTYVVSCYGATAGAN